MIIAGLVMNAFLTGGLFNSIKSTPGSSSSSEFFSAGARNFWSFLGITTIISVILLFLSILTIGMPVGITARMKSAPESAVYLSGILGGSLFAICAMIFLLAADYARAWQVKEKDLSCLKAIGFGFRRTFGSFLTSFPAMLILIISQVLYLLLVIAIAGRWKPLTGGGVFLFFLVSQTLFIGRLFIKTWRYGSVTSLMEINVQPS
jgi:hypothetical protein